MKRWICLPASVFSVVLLCGVVFWTTLVQAEMDENLKAKVNASLDENFLLETLAQQDDSLEGTLMKGLICKRLAICGTDQAVPVVASLLKDEPVDTLARLTLEAIPGDVAEQALLDAALHLQGGPQIGAIDSLGIKRSTKAVPMLKELLTNAETSVVVRKAAYIALGAIASDEAVAFLLDPEMRKLADTPELIAGLGDAMLKAGALCEKDGRFDAAAKLYSATFQLKSSSLRDAALVRAFVLEQTHAAAVGQAFHLPVQCEGDTCLCPECPMLILGLMSRTYSDTITNTFGIHKDDYLLAVRAIYKVAPGDALTLTEESLKKIGEFATECQAALLLALAKRPEPECRQKVFPVLLQACQSNQYEIQLAAIQSLKYVGDLGPLDALCAVNFSAPQQEPDKRAKVLQAMIETSVALPGVEVDQNLTEMLHEGYEYMMQPEMADNVCAFLKIINLRRTQAAAPDVMRIATQKGIDPTVRDAALAALAEIVTIDNLELLAQALEVVEDEHKVANTLQAACIRLPREECAAAVVKMFEKATDADQQLRLLTLLKQIGGPTALACVASACEKPETVDAASATLGKWNTPTDMAAVADACLKLAKEAPEEKFRIRAIRSYIRVPRQFELPLETKLAMCRTAFDTATRPEEKAMVFEVFKRNIDVRSAQAALSYAGDEAFRELACDTIVAIATKFKGKSEDMKAVLQKVLELTQKPENAAAAKEIIARL